MTSFSISNMNGRLSGTFFVSQKRIDILAIHIVSVSLARVITALFPLYSAYRGDGTNSFPIDLSTNILENTTPFMCIAATLVYRSFELVNSKFKQANKNNMLCCILDSRVNSYPTTVCGTAFS